MIDKKVNGNSENNSLLYKMRVLFNDNIGIKQWKSVRTWEEGEPGNKTTAEALTAWRHKTTKGDSKRVSI